jgi:hypothetical protein
VFNYPSVRTLARFLAREESPANAPGVVPTAIATVPASGEPATREFLDDLSEEDLERELAQRLRAIR